MRKAYAGVTTLLLCAMFGAPATSAATPLRPFILGGQPASSAKWMAYITYPDASGQYEIVCSGTLITPTVVLTAGHCGEDEAGQIRKAASFTVTTGTTNVGPSGGGVQSAVSRVIVYPGYDRASDEGDIALLQLAKRVSAPTIRLATSSDADLEQGGTPATIEGWGATDPSEQNFPDDLQYAPTVVQSASDCSAGSPSNYPFNASDELCAADPPSYSTSVCAGDSGGPLIANDAAGNPVEIGVTSNGPTPCSGSPSSDFARVSAFHSWIAAAAAQATPAPSTTVRFSHWQATLARQGHRTSFNLKPAQTYWHCASRRLVKLLVFYSASGAQNMPVTELWSLNGRLQDRFSESSLATAGSFFGIGNPSGIHGGTWSLTIKSGSVTLGSTRVTLTTRRGC